MMEPGPFQQSFYPDGEHQYLLPDDDGALPAYATTRRTWIMFCVTFGVLHGCAVTSMVYASSLQGKDLSSASLGAFFAAYTTAALFVATDVVRRVGVLYALLTGFCGYVLLAASYLSYEILGGGAVSDAVLAHLRVVEFCTTCPVRTVHLAAPGPFGRTRASNPLQVLREIRYNTKGTSHDKKGNTKHAQHKGQ